MTEKHTVSPRSNKDIEREAIMWRDVLCSRNNNWADIRYALDEVFPSEYSNFRMEIVDRRDINGEDARTTFKPPRILVSKNVYDRVIREDPRARFTLAHELGHLVLHKDFSEKSFARAPNVLMYKNREIEIRAYKNAEWQANRFAAYFLMPTSLINDYRTVEDIMQDFGVSEQAATLRLEEIDKTRGKSIPSHIQEMIRKLKMNIGDS